MARSRRGLKIDVGEAMPSSTTHRDVHAVFFLVSPAEDPALHLRILAQLAGCVEQEGFQEEWISARSHQALREVLLRDDRYLSLVLEPGSAAAALAGKENPGYWFSRRIAGGAGSAWESDPGSERQSRAGVRAIGSP